MLSNLNPNGGSDGVVARLEAFQNRFYQPGFMFFAKSAVTRFVRLKLLLQTKKSSGVKVKSGFKPDLNLC